MVTLFDCQTLGKYKAVLIFRFLKACKYPALTASACSGLTRVIAINSYLAISMVFVLEVFIVLLSCRQSDCGLKFDE